GGDVQRVRDLRLPHNESVLFVKHQFGGSRYFERLIHALDISGSAYGTALRGLEGRSGLVRAREFDIVSGSPRRLKRQLSSEHVLQKLLDLNLLSRVIRGTEEYITVSQAAESDGALDTRFAAARAQHLAEGVLLIGLRDWLRKIGLASFNK